jgi:hypothetical protein
MAEVYVGRRLTAPCGARRQTHARQARTLVCVDQHTSQQRAVEPEILRAWRRRIVAAPSVEDVLWIAKDFLASWVPGDLARLHDGCRPGSVKDIYDVATYALTLERARCKADEASAELAQMAAFFSTASQRIAALLAHAQAPAQAKPAVTPVART